MMNKFLLFALLLLNSKSIFSQSIDFSKTNLIPVNISITNLEIGGKKVVRVTKDAAITNVDEATFVRLNDIDFSNGSIEVKVLSKLLPNAPDTARGFIGITFRINEDNTKFEGIYLRPTNGRANQQIRRNHSIQYFSYPNFKYNTLRIISPGVYESYADMGLNEWIKMKIVIKDSQAILFLNDNIQPSLIVSDLKHGSNSKGAIGLFVDIGTEGFFKDLKVVKENCLHTNL